MEELLMIMDDDYDIIVIGGSANGAQAARIAAKKGARVLIIEDHPTIGIPEHCSGLFSYYGLERLDSMPPPNIVFNPEIYGSRLVAPNGKTITVRKKERHALVCDRAKFDQFLIDKAIEEGAELLKPFRAFQAERSENKVFVKAKSKDGDTISLSSKIIISAEGIRGEIAKQLGLSPPEKKALINAAQFFMKDIEDIDPQLVELFQTREFAPDFFGWIIPMSDSSAKVGLGTSRPRAAKELEKLLNNHKVLKDRVKNSDTYYKIAGRIPITGPVKKTYANQLLLVGDVAGQTKPTTGGGVILGGIAAQIAGEVAAEAIKNDRTDSKYLRRYEKLWKKEIGRNLWIQRKVRNYINLLSDKEMNIFFEKLEKKGIIAQIEKYGDVDNQAKLAFKLLRTLSLYPYYLKTSVKLIKALMQK